MKKYLIAALIISCVLLAACTNKTGSGDSSNDINSKDFTQIQSAIESDSLQTSTTAATTEPIDAVTVSEQTGSDDEFQLMREESLGVLRYGLGEKDVIDALGEPEEKAEAAEWGADGLIHQSWYYKTKGMELNMVKQDDKFNVFTIKISKPCGYKTKKGIGIGSSRKDVEAAYESEINQAENSDDSTSLVAGSIYGGVFFTLKDDKVTEIFFGAAAE
jgi:predicted small secreted protein